MRTLVLLASVVCVAVGAWYLTAPRMRLSYGQDGISTGPGLLATVGAALSAWIGEEASREADAIGWTPYRVPVIAAGFWAVLEGVAFLASPIAGLVAMLPVAYAAWRVAGMLLHRSYSRWQEEMVSGLPSFLTILRVHLDLGRTVPEALKMVLPGASPTLRKELTRSLADMALSSDPRDGLRRLSERVGRREWRAFADTIIQSWDARLTGEALAPLLDLLMIVREKETAETTERLDMVLTVAPGLALMAVAIWGVGGFLLPTLTGGAGLFG